MGPCAPYTLLDAYYPQYSIRWMPMILDHPKKRNKQANKQATSSICHQSIKEKSTTLLPPGQGPYLSIPLDLQSLNVTPSLLPSSPTTPFRTSDHNPSEALRPGIGGMRGSMVIRLRPCMTRVHPPPLYRNIPPTRTEGVPKAIEPSVGRMSRLTTSRYVPLANKLTFVGNSVGDAS